MAPFFMRVKVVQPHPYNGIARKVGEEYEMDDKFVEIMTAIGNVVPVPGQSPVKRDMVADEPRGYRRRDLKSK